MCLMNKMFLFTLVLGIWFFPKVETLNCYVCLPDSAGKCTDTQKQCTSEYNQCYARRLFVFADSKKTTDVQTKGCATSEMCVGFSVDFGTIGVAVTSKCCTGDVCNKDDTTDYKSTPNGKKCYSCTGQDCTRTLNCKGNEDHCIKATENVGENIETYKGCASENVCSHKVSSVMKQYMESEFSCCQGDYCNSATSTSAGLLLLLVPLFPVVWFY